jgi:translocator protein
MKNNIPKLIVSILFPLSIGFLGAIFTTPAIPTWYAGLNKPVFSPPNYVFGPVWTLLYILMGISFYLIWKDGLGKNKAGVAAFAVQLALNFAWSAVFFGLHQPWSAFIVIVLLWLAIFANIYLFYKRSITAARLLIPYITWVSFAAALNLGVAVLN